MRTEKIKPQLTAVPETMLWTLHNRATEAMRNDGIIDDPQAVRIYQTIDYDYEKCFGKAEPSHAIRSAMFDAELRAFLEKHPDGIVVNLGEGLETQRFRVAGDKALWFSIDLPEAIAIRERFIKPDDRHRHRALSALDRKWFANIPKGRPVFITAQGLLMYLPENEVRSLFQDLASQFPGEWFMFDTIPQWLSKKAANGWKKTEYYTTPKAPWGIDRYKVESTLRTWLPTLDKVQVSVMWRYPRGMGRWIFPILGSFPIINRYTPTITLIKFGNSTING